MKKYTVYLQGEITMFANNEEDAVKSVKRKLEVVPKMFDIKPMIVKEQYDIIGDVYHRKEGTV